MATCASLAASSSSLACCCATAEVKPDGRPMDAIIASSGLRLLFACAGCAAGGAPLWCNCCCHVGHDAREVGGAAGGGIPGGGCGGAMGGAMCGGIGGM